jgi:antirestriction protein ArdC
VEGIPEDKIPDTKSHDHDFDPIGACEELIECWEDSPQIELDRNQACYIPFLDKVQMPNPRTFFKDEEYYSVLFHELTHSTGHHSRLNRHEKFSDLQFASHDYSQEEMVAEMGAAYLCGICGIENNTIDNSAAYIQGWLRKLKSDNKFVIQAASYAQRAVDYILEHQKKPMDPAVAKSEEEAIPVSFSF